MDELYAKVSGKSPKDVFQQRMEHVIQMIELAHTHGENHIVVPEGVMNPYVRHHLQAGGFAIRTEAAQPLWRDTHNRVRYVISWESSSKSNQRGRGPMTRWTDSRIQ